MAAWLNNLENGLHRIPIRCGFAGWESDTARLSSAGWKFFASATCTGWSPFGEFEVVAKHPPTKMIAIGVCALSPDAIAAADVLAREAIIAFRGVHSDTSSVVIHGHGEVPSFVEVDPFAFYHAREMTLALLLPAVAAPTIQDIEVREEDVHDVLAKILEAQQPRQAEIRSKRRRGAHGVTSIARVVALAGAA